MSNPVEEYIDDLLKEMEEEAGHGPVPLPDHYHNDTPQSLYNEMKQGEIALADAGRMVLRAAKLAGIKKAHYEKLKNDFVIEILAAESAPDFDGKKSTDKSRESLYRDKYAVERLEATLAENEWKSCKDYIDTLKAQQVSKAVRMKLLDYDGRWGGRLS